MFWKKVGPQKGNESSNHQFSGANLLVSGMFLVLAQNVINSNYLLIAVMKKQSVHSVCEPRSSEITSHIPFFHETCSLRLSTSFGQKPTTKNPSRQKHLRKKSSAMRWLWTDGIMRGLLGRKGGILDSCSFFDETWKVHGNCHFISLRNPSGIGKKPR